MKILSKLLLLCLILSFYNKGNSQAPVSRTNRQERAVLYKKTIDPKKIGPSPARASSTNANSRLKAAVQNISFSEWSYYSGSSLVEKLKNVTDYDAQLRSLFDFNESEGERLFTSSNIEAVARAMYNISISHDGTINSGMLGLVSYLHAANYHSFFAKTIVKFDAEASYWYELACISFSKNQNLFVLSDDALKIFDEYMTMLDRDEIRSLPEVISLVKKIMRNLVLTKNWKQISDQDVLHSYSVMANRVFTILFQCVEYKDPVFIQAAKYDSELFSLQFDIAVDPEIKADNKLNFMQANAVGELARAASINELLPQVENHLVAIARFFDEMHVNWLRAVEAINKYSDCSKYNLCYDLVDLRDKLIKKLFPHTWSFEDGKMLIKTPLSYEHVEPLYYAAKQVQAQTFRILKSDTPVVGDNSEVLTMMVYGTLNDYETYQAYLTGLPTNNGGMYIERDATFYTYERTPEESTYTLEELFRHEYTHYLQGRYMEEGLWSETDFFDNDRLTWFEEGMAEFMAGSTSSDGVQLRASMLYGIENDGSNRMSVYETIGASYDSGFKFYRYAYIIWLYMYQKDMLLMRELINYVKSDDIAGFDAKINTLRNSSDFQRRIDTYTDEILAQKDQWWTTETAYLPDDNLSVGNISDIEREFKTISGLSNIQVVTDANASIKRFGVKGKLTGANLDNQLNQLIKRLEADKYINNFDYLVGYYKNTNTYDTDFYITGSLRDGSISSTPVCNFKLDSKVQLVGETIKLTSTSTGYIKGFRWEAQNANFSDQYASQSNISFSTPGKYNIKLIVTGYDGQVYTKLIEDAVEIFAQPGTEYCSPKSENNYAYIQYVKVGNIENINDKYNPSGYADFTNIVTTLTKNTSQQISVDVSYSYDETHLKAWIDWNQDGAFTVTEEIINTTGKNPLENYFSIPSNALDGITRLRVRYVHTNDLDACEYNTYIGETHDYSVVITGGGDNTDFIAPTTPTNLTQSNVTSSSALLNWNESTDNVGVMGYQIFANNTLLKTCSENYNEITGLTADTYYEIYVRAIDFSGNTSNASYAVSFTTQAAELSYCASQGNSQSYEWIKGVSMANLSNRSEASPYSDFTHVVSRVNPGEQTWITIEPGFRPNQPYRENIRVWVDWNKNGVFELDETILDQTGNTVMGTWFTVPSTFSGSTRMRVSLQEGSKPNACGTFPNGEVEDYTISTTGSKSGKQDVSNILMPEKQASFTAYPNPTDGIISLIIPEQYNDASILVVNTLGVTVLLEKVNSSLQQLNLNSLSTGNYFIILRNDKGSLKKQIIVN